jgi:transcriptional regulator with XRE-family HTH domain
MTESQRSPIHSRRRLSAALRRARDEAGFTQEQVAAEMDWSLSKLIRIERGYVKISTSDLRVLLQHYRITEPAEVQHFVEWARVSRARPWWSPYRARLPSSTFEALLGLESDAATIAIFNCVLVPGLLQTEEYAKSLLATYNAIYLATDDAHARLQVRLRRQEEVLRRRQRLDVILDEAVLRRATLDPATMLSQLNHLIDLAERPEVSIAVLPFDAGPYGTSVSFSILSFEADEDEHDVVYLELFDTDTLLEHPHEVALYRRLFEWTRGRALDRAASADLMRQVADEFVKLVRHRHPPGVVC